MRTHHYPSDVTDEQWPLIEPHIPVYPGGRPRKTDVRDVLDAVLYILRTGCQWRYLPMDFPPKSTVWRYVDEWRHNGTLDVIHDALRRKVRTQEKPYHPRTTASVDSQSVDTTSGGEARGRDNAKNVDGRKRHIVVDSMGKPGVRKTRCQKTRCQFSFPLHPPLVPGNLADMGRLLRPDDDGLLFHAINRGNNRDVVFADDEDHFAFLQSLGRTQLRYPFRLYGYCLMSNHFHLLLRPEPGTTISRVLQSLTVAHTWRFQRRHRTTGHVWQGRFKSPVVQADDHLWAVLRYIEANPLRAGMVADMATYRWSSYPAHGEGRADPLLTPLPEWPDLGPDEAARRAAWRGKVMADQPVAELESIRRSIRGGLPFGDMAWAQEMATKLGTKLERRPPGRPRKPAQGR